METISYIGGKCEVELGLTYAFTHKTKGRFMAKITAVEPTKPGDPDPYFVRVEIDTREGSGQAWMPNVVVYKDGKKTTPEMTEKLLRPSKILKIEMPRLEAANGVK